MPTLEYHVAELIQNGYTEKKNMAQAGVRNVANEFSRCTKGKHLNAPNSEKKWKRGTEMTTRDQSKSCRLSMLTGESRWSTLSIYTCSA